MSVGYPYIISNNKIEPVLARIRSAAKPERLSHELMSTWGFTASNDRAMPRVLKSLGFLNDNGTPTALYDRLRDPTSWRRVLGERVRHLYSELFAMDSNIHTSAEAEIKGAISRITGQDEETVKRYFATFKTLCKLADFSQDQSIEASQKQSAEAQTQAPPPAQHADHTISSPATHHRKSEYHYNIQIHLPVTTDITVYNAIFKSLRENLGV